MNKNNKGLYSVLLGYLEYKKRPGVKPGGLFYIQDTRQYVGNNVLWWKPDGNGYTTNIAEAGKYTRDQAKSLMESRDTDFAWPTSYIDKKTRLTVDAQYINVLDVESLVTPKPVAQKKERLRCHSCGCFMSERQLWGGECPRCGIDNRP